MSLQNQLSLDAANATVEWLDNDYRRISPLYDFGLVPDSVARRIIGYERQASEINRATSPQAITTLGWAALEAAAILPEDSEHRDKFIAASFERFKSVAETKPVETIDFMARYTAKMGMIAVEAYRQDPEQIRNDNPGLYAELLDELVKDFQFKRHSPRQRRAFISEVTVAGIASYGGFLVLPASTRHDCPLNVLKPKMSHDLQVWFRPPEVFPAKPDRKVQVKTSHERHNRKKYASNITMVIVNDVLGTNDNDLVPRLLSRFYNGTEIHPSGMQILEDGKLAVKGILRQEVEEVQPYGVSMMKRPGTSDYRRPRL